MEEKLPNAGFFRPFLTIRAEKGYNENNLKTEGRKMACWEEMTGDSCCLPTAA